MKKLKVPTKYLILIAFAGLIITLDQLSKTYFHTQYLHGDSVSVIKDFFSFTYVRNPGAAFGLFRDTHEDFRSVFFTLVPLLAMLIIINMLRSLAESERVQILALSSVFGGAIGNYIDRLRFGYVIDFLDFKLPYYVPMKGWGVYVWPAFNVADVGIVCGVTLLILNLLRESWEERQRSKPTSRKNPATSSS